MRLFTRFRARIARSLVTIFALTFIQIITAPMQVAEATGTPAVNMPTIGWAVGASTNTIISGASVSGLGASDTYLITLALSGTYGGATLQLTSVTGLTASYGYTLTTSTTFTKISFTGTATDINNALNVLQYNSSTAPNSGTTPSVSISAVENISGLAYNPTNGHYYKAVKYTDSVKPSDNNHSTAMTWANAQTFAGQNGYLVTITSADENDFVASSISNASNIWIGGRDNWSGGGYSFAEGTWGWASVGSPEYGQTFTTAGYSNWCSGEPNNAGSGEHMAVTNWGTGQKCWNDLPDYYSTVAGLVVEFGTNAAGNGFTNAVSASTPVYVAPTIEIKSGNNQIGNTSTALGAPPKVIVKDSIGTVATNLSISWASTRGTVDSATSKTDASGIATQPRWVMPSSAGQDTLTATLSVSGSNVVATFNAMARSFPLSNYETDSTLSFNGTSQYAIASGKTILPTSATSAFTIEVWVNPSADGADSVIFGQGGTGSSRFYLKRHAGKFLWIRDGWGLASEQDCGAFPNGAWTHLAVTYNGSNTVKCYMNGTLMKTTSVTSGSTALTAPATIAKYSVTNSNYYAGLLDELKIWGVERSLSNISTDLSTHTDTTTANLLAYYDFNEGTGGTLYNLVRSDTSTPVVVDFSTVSTPTWNTDSVVATIAYGPYSVTTFKRTYLTLKGGWRAPDSITAVTALVVGGGGGAGYNSGGGGGGGAVNYTGKIQLNTYTSVIVGYGGIGGVGTGDNTMSVNPTNGGTSYFGSYSANGGGAGANYSGTVTIAAAAGGSGGNVANRNTGDGGKGATTSTSAEAGVAGYSTTYYSASTQYFGGGGGGGGWNRAGSAGAGTPTTGGGGAGSDTGAGGNGSANTGGGGGSGGATATYSGCGGTGVVIIKWITALKPTFTAPSNAYLNVGMTETFTTNVANDSETVLLTRTFRWESRTPTSGGNYSTIKVGTGAANAAFSWIPSDTTTSGSTYLYRVIVTDSDTAGLFIVDTSTSVYAVINQTLVVTGNASIGKKIAVAKSETFTITNGTITYKTTLTSNNVGITLDTTTASMPIVKIYESMTVGTYYETLTVIDSVSATIVIPLTIVVAAPPQLTNYGEIVTDGQVLNIDFSNSNSYNPVTGDVKDISGANKGVTKSGTPTFLNENSGIAKFQGSAGTTGTQYLQVNDISQLKKWTAEVYFRIDALSDYSTSADRFIIANELIGTNSNFYIYVHAVDANTALLYAGFNKSSTNCYVVDSTPISKSIWYHVVATWDGINEIKLYVDGAARSTTKTGSPSGDAQMTAGSRVWINRFYTSASYTSYYSYGFVRLYNRALSAAEVSQNYNATKDRFVTANVDRLYPSRKYGLATSETFTATAGYGVETITYTVGPKPGLSWTTSGGVTTLALSETLSASTYNDTITVTDALGASTYLPIKVVISKADTITVTSGPSLTTVYTGSVAANGPVTRVTQLVGIDTATVQTIYTYKATGNTCATGGACAIGDRGPGGGWVFYSSPTPIDEAPGISTGGTYLEIAPAGWSTYVETSTVWSTTDSVIGSTSSNIGSGALNTFRIVEARGSDALAAYAASIATYGGKSDWFLPSASELEKAYLNLKSQSIGDLSGINYWSSTEYTGYESSHAFNYWMGGNPNAGPATKSTSLTWRPIRAFTPGIVETTTVPVDVETYTVRGANITFQSGTFSNYETVVYETSTLKITQAKQAKLSINLYGAVAGAPFNLQVFGGSGDGAVTETVTAGGSGTNCRIASRVLRNDNTNLEQVSCIVTVTKAASRNYLLESLTATVYFLFFQNNAPAPAAGSGTTIALTGENAVWVVPGTPPVITSGVMYSGALGSLLSLTATNVGGSTIPIRFWEGVPASGNINLSNGIYTITVTVPMTAVTGPVAVLNGTAEAPIFFTVTP